MKLSHPPARAGKRRSVKATNWWLLLLCRVPKVNEQLGESCKFLIVVKWAESSAECNIVSSTHFEHKSVHFLTNVSVAKETAVLRRIDQQIQKAQSSFSCSNRRFFNLNSPFKLKMSLLPSRSSSALSSTAADFCSLSRRFSNFLSRMTCPVQTIHFQIKFHSIHNRLSLNCCH